MWPSSRIIEIHWLAALSNPKCTQLKQTRHSESVGALYGETEVCALPGWLLWQGPVTGELPPVRGEEKVKDLRVAFICISWPLFFFFLKTFQAVKLMDYLSASQSSFYPLFVFLDWASSCLLLRPPEHTGQARVLRFDLCWWEFHYFSHRNKGDETPNRNYMWLWNSMCFFFFFFDTFE